MAKRGTYFIIGALITMLSPYLLSLFGAYELSESSFFPQAAMILGSVGVLLHLWSGIKSKRMNTSGAMLLISILTIIFGFSLDSLGVIGARYVLLLGTLLVAVWIMLPSKKEE